MNTARRGNAKEVRTAELLEAEGLVVGSRRHIAGPGDLLAVRPVVTEAISCSYEALLIEVKATRTPYDHFRPEDREALREYAAANGLLPRLAYWAPRARSHEIIGPENWPR